MLSELSVRHLTRASCSCDLQTWPLHAHYSPRVNLAGVACTLLLYWTAGMTDGFGRVVYFILNLIALLLVSETLVMAIAPIVRDLSCHRLCVTCLREFQNHYGVPAGTDGFRKCKVRMVRCLSQHVSNAICLHETTASRTFEILWILKRQSLMLGMSWSFQPWPIDEGSIWRRRKQEI